MARMRLIGTTLDDGYRDDLNFNFGLLEALIGESNGLTEALRQEMLEKIYNLQTQIDMLTGENIGELLARLNDAIQQALTAAQEARTAKTATEEATALAIAAKELAIASATLADEKAAYAEGKAILAQEAADNANQEAANLGQMKVAVVQATQDANTATSNANQATEEAQTATNAINAVLPNVTGLENLQEWSSTIAYKKNNFVTFEGNGYMALQNNINISPPSFPTLSNDDWAMLVQKGEKGEQGTGVRILGTLVNESELPSIGEPGDAYLINGDLYVWSDTTNDWTNVGTIKGPKGEQGIQGPKGDKGDKGDPGEDADVEAINQQIDTLRTEVTEQLEQMKPKVDNSWQKGVYNDTDITNLGKFNAKRSFFIKPSDWQAVDSNLEQLNIVIPTIYLSGIVKVTYTCSWVGTNGEGGAEVIYNYAKAETHIRAHSKTITSISPQFAQNYYVADLNQNNDNVMISLIRVPSAKNYMTVTVELYTTQENTMDMLKDAYPSFYDLGTSWDNYPWTPQASQIPTYDAISRWDSVAHRFKPACELVADWNNVTENGMYMALNATNAPRTDAWFMGTVIVHQPNWIVQKLILFTGDQEFERTNRGGTWDEWIETSPRRLFQSVSDGKTKVASAISDKGVYTSPIETFENMANNIRLIQTGPKIVDGTLSVASISPRSTSADYVTPLIDFEPRYCSTRWGGACIFDYAEIWEGTTAYSDGSHTLRMIKEQVSGKWQIRMRFYNALSYATSPDTIRYRITN